jgi:hypothetical protein
MTKPLTFAEFKATETEYDIKDALDIIGMEADCFEGTDTEKVLVYNNGPYITRLASGEHHCFIYRDETTGSKDHCAAYLYFDFYWNECLWGEKLTEEFMTDALNNWYEWQGLPHLSADEMQYEIAATEPAQRTKQQKYQIEWLSGFISTWDENT